MTTIAITPAFVSFLDAAPLVQGGNLHERGERAGASRFGGLGWFGELVRERLLTSLGDRAARDWDAVYPGLDAERRVDRHVATAARKAALCGGLSAATAEVGEAVSLAMPLCMAAVVTAVAGEVVASAKLQIDLIFDLASIYGVAFDASDITALGTIFDLALCSDKPQSATSARTNSGDEILARVGRSLLESAVLSLVPLVGIPCTAARSYQGTMKVGAVARRVLRQRGARRTVPRAHTLEEAIAA